MKVKLFFKNHWYKLLSALCVLCFCFLSVYYSCPVSASSGSGSGLIRGSKPITYTEALNSFAEKSGLSSYYIFEHFNVENYGSAYGYKFINKNIPNHLHYFWKDDDGVIQYRFVDENEDDSPVLAGTSVPATVTGKEFKELKDYWSNYYQPHENAQQFTWSYQTRGCTNPSPYDIGIRCPIYLNTNGNWGGKNWDDYYFLFFYSDDSSGTYYSSEYCHVYTEKTDDGVLFHYDRYSLASGELYKEGSVIWKKVSECPYVGVRYNNGMANSNHVMIEMFKDYSDYLSAKNSNFLASFSFNDMIGTNFIKSSLKLYNMVRSVEFTPNTNINDDWGLICSSEPFELFADQTHINYNKIPDNYTITINGDTIYDYSITNPDTGDSTTINNYITNNYIIPDNGGSSNSGDSGNGDVNVTVGGNVSVGGKVDVSGKIEIDTKPIDININVNGGTGGSSGSGTGEVNTPSGVEFDQDLSLNNYYDWMQEQTTGFSGFMKNFFAWLPDPIVIMLCAGFALVILARFLGR